ncbi:DUF2007 domain-containing protein [Flavobacterium aquidurense]|uniref:putative signal transducing protein n=1 Tax=Flavobacterium aquidurense TaxID=362413 RepID=UPI00286610F6|nr:DUF2007 domain-containing protein [Flavobacterium aquidurense]MDR7372521.1 hypothetical protein [Flavobacterium aquidurense]
MIEIFRGSYIEVMSIKNLLKNNNIDAFIANENMSNIQPWSVSAGGNAPAILKVTETEYNDAKKIITNYNNGEFDLIT